MDAKQIVFVLFWPALTAVLNKVLRTKTPEAWAQLVITSPRTAGFVKLLRGIGLDTTMAQLALKTIVTGAVQWTETKASSEVEALVKENEALKKRIAELEQPKQPPVPPTLLVGLLVLMAAGCHTSDPPQTGCSAMSTACSPALDGGAQYVLVCSGNGRYLRLGDMPCSAGCVSSDAGAVCRDGGVE